MKKVMNLYNKLLYSSILILLMPFLVPVVGYLVLSAQTTNSQLIGLGFIPPIIREELVHILENPNQTPDPTSSRFVVAVMIEDKGWVYARELFPEVDIQPGAITISEEGFRVLPFDTIFGVARFRYRSENGAVVYALRPASPLSWLSQNFLLLVLFVSLFLFLIPALLNWFFLRDLRRRLQSLEMAAENISRGSFEEQVLVPQDPALAPLFSAFETMRTKLNDSSEYRHRFLLAISHDLKSPLASILGYLEALDDRIYSNEEEMEQFLRIVRRKSELLEQRIQELLDFARIETLDWKRQFEPLLIGELLLDLANHFGRECSLKGMVFDHQIAFDATGVWIRGDSRMLLRAIENILENSSRYCPSGSKILLTSWATKTEVRIRIEDSGPGISDAEKSRVFDQFYRGEGARSTQGIGLGLPSTESIIRTHGGSVTLEDSPNLGGVCFTLTLPIVQEHLSNPVG